MFDVAKFPTATYKGKVSKWGANGPEEITGDLTLHGVTKPVTPQGQFLALQAEPDVARRKSAAPMPRRPSTAPISASTTRSQMGFKPEVTLRIYGRRQPDDLIGICFDPSTSRGACRKAGAPFASVP